MQDDIRVTLSRDVDAQVGRQCGLTNVLTEKSVGRVDIGNNMGTATSYRPALVLREVWFRKPDFAPRDELLELAQTRVEYVNGLTSLETVLSHTV